MMYSFDVFDKVDSEYKYESIQTADFYDVSDEELDKLYGENLVEQDLEEWEDEMFDLQWQRRDISYPQARI